MNDIKMPFVDGQIDRCYAPGIDRIDIPSTGDADLHLRKITIVDGVEKLLRRRG